MRFNEVETENWCLLPDGRINIHGRSYSRGVAGEVLTAFQEAIAEHDLQVEANKPKPGDFGPGDTVRPIDDCTSVSFKVYDIDGDLFARSMPGGNIMGKIFDKIRYIKVVD